MTIHRTYAALVAVIVVGLLVPAGADTMPLLDQTSPYTGTLYPLGTSHWQSFTAGMTGTLYSITVNPWWRNPEHGFTLSLYSGNGIGGAQLYTESGIYINNGNGPETFNVVLGGSMWIEESQQYTFELTHASPFQLVGYNWAHYAGGRSDYSATSDYNFSTYVDPIPEPHSLLLTLLGLGFVRAGVRTNKRRA